MTFFLNLEVATFASIKILFGTFEISNLEDTVEKIDTSIINTCNLLELSTLCFKLKFAIQSINDFLKANSEEFFTSSSNYDDERSIEICHSILKLYRLYCVLTRFGLDNGSYFRDCRANSVFHFYYLVEFFDGFDDKLINNIRWLEKDIRRKIRSV